MFHIDNPFASKGEAPTAEASEIITQNPEINSKTAEQVAHLGIQAVQSVDIAPSVSTSETDSFAIPDMTLPSVEQPTEINVGGEEREPDLLDTDNLADLYSTAGAFGGGDLPSERAAAQEAASSQTETKE